MSSSIWFIEPSSNSWSSVTVARAVCLRSYKDILPESEHLTESCAAAYNRKWLYSKLLAMAIRTPLHIVRAYPLLGSMPPIHAQPSHIYADTHTHTHSPTCISGQYPSPHSGPHSEYLPLDRDRILDRDPIITLAGGTPACNGKMEARVLMDPLYKAL